MDYNFDHQMSLSKNKCWYSNYGLQLHFKIVLSIDFLVKAACLATEENNHFNFNITSSKVFGFKESNRNETSPSVRVP